MYIYIYNIINIHTYITFPTVDMARCVSTRSMRLPHAAHAIQRETPLPRSSSDFGSSNPMPLIYIEYLTPSHRSNTKPVTRLSEGTITSLKMAI